MHDFLITLAKIWLGLTFLTWIKMLNQYIRKEDDRWGVQMLFLVMAITPTVISAVALGLRL